MLNLASLYRSLYPLYLISSTICNLDCPDVLVSLDDVVGQLYRERPIVSGDLKHCAMSTTTHSSHFIALDPRHRLVDDQWGRWLTNMVDVKCIWLHRKTERP